MDDLIKAEYEAICDRFLKAEGWGGRSADNHGEGDYYGKMMVNAASYVKWCLTGMPRRERMPYIHFDYAADPRLNAMAFQSEGTEFIVFSEGAVLLVLDLFHRMLAHRNVLPTAGDVSGEREEIIPLPKLFDNMSDLLGSHPIYVPQDSQRKALASHLSSLALRFLCAHEYGHLLYGHVGYYNEKSGHAFIAEARQSASTKEVNLTRQMLEVDADSCGAVDGLSSLFTITTQNATQNSLFEEIAKTSSLPIHVLNANLTELELDRFYIIQESEFFNWCFAVYSLFCLFGVEASPVSELENDLYPPSYLRAYWIMVTGRAWFLKYQGEARADWFVQIATRALGEAIKAVRGVTNGAADYSGFLLLQDPRLLAHLEQLHRRWNTVRPFLEQHARGVLAPLHVFPDE